MKRMMIIATAVILLLTLCACGGIKEENKLIGTWILDERASSRDGFSFSGDNKDLYTLVFYKDGTWEAFDEDHDHEAGGTFEVIYDGAAISLRETKLESTVEPLYFSFEGKYLTIDYKGYSLVYTRGK